MGISARPVMMSLTIAAAGAFLTPIATAANLMVMEPAGYRFGDYWKLGLLMFGAIRRGVCGARPDLLVFLTAPRHTQPIPSDLKRQGVPTPIGAPGGCLATPAGRGRPRTVDEVRRKWRLDRIQRGQSFRDYGRRPI